ncbi:MAG: pentapeptide repeat-containing protein [Planctomycetaceae bacterium]|nr:pentapeptide repeat-containing protein [Planctomycetaceae bacterium]
MKRTRFTVTNLREVLIQTCPTPIILIQTNLIQTNLIQINLIQIDLIQTDLIQTGLIRIGSYNKLRRKKPPASQHLFRERLFRRTRLVFRNRL